MAEEKTGMSRGRKILIGFIIVLFLLTAGAYFFGVYYFTEHFLPGSLVNGFNCSYMTEAEAEDLLEQKTAAYVLAVQTRGNGQESISADQIQLAYTSDGSVNKLLHQQNRFLWFVAFSQHQTYQVPSSVTYDQDLFDETVGGLKCLQNNEQPVDASIQDSGDKFVVVAEKEGTLVDQDKLKEDISDAVTTGRTVANLEEDGCYINPSVYSEDLTRDCQQMNELADVVITYDFDDRKETVDRSVIRDWLTRDSNGNLVLDRDAVASYVKTLAEKYDTPGTERSFVTYDSREITVSGGNYGWVIDQPGETEELYQAIMDHKTQVREPVYSSEASSRKTNDIGYTYIEINLTDSRLVFYKEGQPLVDTGFVASSSTAEGVFAVGDKKESAVPGGGTGNEVSCWIPFDKVGIYGEAGLEISTGSDTEEADFGSSGEADFSSSLDSSWASTEGCVVLPLEQAQELCQYTEAGMPVVIYK